MIGCSCRPPALLFLKPVALCTDSESTSASRPVLAKRRKWEPPTMNHDEGRYARFCHVYNSPNSSKSRSNVDGYAKEIKDVSSVA
ncbi:hypothetical protein BU23DRAFT_89371 [Bimuria novae-zelandiae CBS 107.79]|uniref:Uncharacterized protein n=1 Tax=Bimuria novae-zelandiae CBS 107.79 TaxID=1447943 RepID=A0A6A5VC43_9PLEO|nr:hypothetical protein BU23DRAFT_89371 [Bimuria novae-zelandiae CBS 107.79]